VAFYAILGGSKKTIATTLKTLKHYALAALLIVSFFGLVLGMDVPVNLLAYNDFAAKDALAAPPDTGQKDTLHYPFKDRYTDPLNAHYTPNGLYLNDPSNIKMDIEYNPDERQYDISERIGSQYFRNPSYLTFDEYVNHEYDQSTKSYWKQRANEESATQKKGFAPRLYVGGEAFNRIFGGNTIDIRPQGSAELSFGLQFSRYDNPTLPEKQRRNTSFDFKEKIQLNVIGNIGEKLKITTNYNTEASFDFENKLKLEYTGLEDEIIKKIEAGNVTLPLQSSLIQGSQSLFGIKTQLQFGRMTVTSIFSQQKGSTSHIAVEGGATTTPFDIAADQYESNKHFFLAQYFRENYDLALSNLPFVNSPVNITKIEVWRTNTVNVTTDNRNIVAMLDLGEKNFYNKNVPGVINNNFPFNVGYPSDSSNSLYYQLTHDPALTPVRDFDKAASVMSSITGFQGSRDYEVVLNARKLEINKDFSYNRQLGYISLTQPLNPNDVLAVAFEYTIGNKVYKVGDLTTDNIQSPKTLLLKLIKSKITNTSLPTWDLMMKNVYSLGGFQIEKEDFKLDVLYYADTIGTRLNFIPTTPNDVNIFQKPLNRLLNLDRLNVNNDPRPDGQYDFIEGVTISTSNGRIIFPVLEPFGSYLRAKSVSDTVANNYVFDILYDSTRAQVLQKPEKNKFSIKGSYKSKSSSEINLNAFNILEGSVKVTAGGSPLTENVDYTVDYNLGKVKIINQGILESNTKIDVTVENNSLFSIQSKTMMGSRFDYVINKDFALGGTILRLNERPITKKVNIGDEPISNTIWGVDGTYKTDSRFITKLVDKLPFISTKEPSNVTFMGEFANLIPGNNKAIGKNGVAYIDDFEGSQSTTDLKNIGSWMIASTPSGRFSEGSIDNDVKYGYNRAKISWYTIDPLFYRLNSQTPSNIDDNAISDNLVRQVGEKEIFPNKEAQGGQVVILPMFDVAYYPAERGPYNYDKGPSDVSAGTNANGLLNNPPSRWGGIMRRVESPDFEASNTEFIQFWIMDPNTNGDAGRPAYTGGDLYFDLGNISEDVLKDNRKQYENGLPKTAAAEDVQLDTTQWGVVPRAPSVNYAFDNNPDSRQYQDVGFDGLNNAKEQSFFQSFVNYISANVIPANATKYINDPSSDNFKYYNVPGDNTSTILDRYKDYSNNENNSPVDPSSSTNVQSGSNQPDVEDINKDSNTETSEQYYEYKVDLRPSALVVGQNNIVDKITRQQKLPNGNAVDVTWYQVKIPVREPNNVVGGIEGFNSIGFIRMYMTGFENPTVLRFAKLEFLKGEWRKYQYDLASFETIGGDPDNVGFDVSAVSIEENGNKVPINYVLPPGIDQELNIGSTTTQHLNEQSLSFKITGLQDGNAKGAFKTLETDLRSYKKLKMYAHAEAVESSDALRNGDLRLFVRLGSDITDNYYEYEIPLEVTQWGETDKYKIWPESNWLDLELDKLVQLKLERNNANFNLTSLFTLSDGKNYISIKGNPTLSSVRTILVGIRNPKQDAFNPNGDDGQTKSCEVWINELRLTDFDKRGGWAANGRVSAKLANLGNVSATGTHKSIGFGAIDQKVSERSKEAETSWNVNSNLYLGKFFPEKTGLDIPMYVSYGQIVKNPQYDPLNEDVKFKDAIDFADTKEEKKEIKKRSQDYTKKKSINFTNVKKNKTGGGKSHVYDIENFSFNYGYDETYHRDINVEYDFVKEWKGGFAYSYNTNPKGITPFAKTSGMKSKYIKPIKDFNINFIPSSLNFRTDIRRVYGEKLFRNNTDYSSLQRDTFFNKDFRMDRFYDLKYDITKSLKFDFNANNSAVVDEPEGRIDTREEKDSLKNNFWQLGRNRNYIHTGNLSYQVPLNKFPLTDWISVNAKYSFNYGWEAGQFLLDSATNRYAIDERTGNTIQNSNTQSLNGNFTLTQLYNKVPFLKKINTPKPKTPATKAVPKQDPKPKIPEPPGTPADSTKAAKPKEKKKGDMPDAVRFVGKMILGLKSVGLTYAETKGTVLPGYRNYSQILGQDLDKNSPGFPFAFGSQKDVRPRAFRDAWLTPDTSFNRLYVNTYVQNITGRATIEPIDGLKVELNASKNLTQSQSEYYRYNGSTFEHQNPTETGSFSISFLSLNSAFVKDDDVNYTNKVFEEFINNRQVISRRLAELNSNSQGFSAPDSFGTIYNDGYGGTQQEVLTAAFLAAYSGKSAETIGLNPFLKIPKPNWRITYDGLSRIPLFKKLFNTVSISHGYRSTFNINSFGRSLLYSERNEDASARDFSNNFIARKEIGQVSISEQFSPLLGVDVTWKNNIQTRIEYKKDRNLSLSFVGTQLTEVKGNEVVIGFGYRIPKFNLPTKVFGKKKKKTSGGGGIPVGGNSLNLTADFSIRKNVTIVRKMLEGINQPTAGLNVFSLKTGADYAVSERLNVRLFFETTSNTPVISTSYPTTNTQAGIAVRFSLAQ
jgi:cell surface protein SprA